MNITVWNEGRHEKTSEYVRSIHPEGIHGEIAEAVRDIEGAEVRTVLLDDPECGLPDELLEKTDVLIWWGHMAHGDVPDELVDKIQRRVLMGMGLIVLHSAHASKIFARLIGTSGRLRWRDGAYERIFTCMPGHPIAKGIPEYFELGKEEMYGEYFDIPQPDEQIFSAWFDTGDIFRCGNAWYRGYGKVFYFQPGHETNESYKNEYVKRIIRNACEWAAPTNRINCIDFPHVESLEEARKKREGNP